VFDALETMFDGQQTMFDALQIASWRPKRDFDELQRAPRALRSRSRAEEAAFRSLGTDFLAPGTASREPEGAAQRPGTARELVEHGFQRVEHGLLPVEHGFQGVEHGLLVVGIGLQRVEGDPHEPGSSSEWPGSGLGCAGPPSAARTSPRSISTWSRANAVREDTPQALREYEATVRT
jgi:hypothetical protein